MACFVAIWKNECRRAACFVREKAGMVVELVLKGIYMPGRGDKSKLLDVAGWILAC